jgi:AbiJ N-terminal domain 4
LRLLELQQRKGRCVVVRLAIIAEGMDSFSQRNKLAGSMPGTLLRDVVPNSFRMFLVNLPRDHSIDLEFHELLKATCDVLQVWPDENFPPYFDYRRHIQSCDWFHIYDIIEGVYRLLDKKRSGYSSYTTPFVRAINEALLEQNIGWQLSYDGHVLTRGDEAFEGTITDAVSVLVADGKPTAAKHLKFALNALSTRPKANTSGAVSHATSAVECVLGQIAEGATLGDYLKKPGLFQPTLKKGLEGIWGYASDVARHGKEGIEPSHEDAEFVIATCAATCTLLTKRHPK